MVEVLGTLLGGIAVGILTPIVLAQFEVGREFLWRVFTLPYRSAWALAEGGIQRFTLHRPDYHRVRVGAGSLREYLATAQSSIEAVSISLNVTQAECDLISLFAEKLNADPNFRVRITLLDPLSAGLPLLAKSLDLEPQRLRTEVEDTLTQLVRCKQLLRPGVRERLDILIHDTLPIGSALLLDASPNRGRIQVETKLYRAPRTESFGFEVVGPSGFYKRNYTAWQRVFLDSVTWQPPSAS